ncbi:MAG: NAD(P)-dependent oxidoreductase [Bradyrhizobium sp.]|uniref:NAD-dependent epimerase/dehydratase family protein n=1 Tax=Bradyrhizobium sp. TaxID=376 RepID=UPI0012277695|nr:NAD(P)-dependent oxidoreductase [Bradyrhizobium sp.]THD73151.1 MAG: NAD(P)-dependent oxidoreductase [Bradyrhizobium sp.]
MRVLVTGGCGYIGRYVVSELLRIGHHVTVAQRRLEGVPAGAEGVSFDIFALDRGSFDRLGRPEVCVNLAWEDGFDHNSAKHLDNVGGHVRFIRFLVEAGIKQIVGVGSVHEVGFYEGMVNERTATNPAHAYAIAKNFLRQVQKLLCNQRGIVSQWARCHYVVGDDRRTNSVFKKLLEAEDQGKLAFDFNSGEMLRDFIDVGSLGRQIAIVASQTAVAGTIDCCSGKPVSLRSRVTSFIADHQLKIVPMWGNLPARPYDSSAIWGDPSRFAEAARALGPLSSVAV